MREVSSPASPGSTDLDRRRIDVQRVYAHVISEQPAEAAVIFARAVGPD